MLIQNIKVKGTITNNPVFNDLWLIKPLMKKIQITGVTEGKETACMISSTVWISLFVQKIQHPTLKVWGN